MDDALRMLADAAAAFARPDGRRTRAMRALPGGFDRATWAAFGEQGWLSILIPESAGGLGLGIDAAAVVAGRLGYAGYREPFTACGVMAAQLLGASPNAALRDSVLPAFMEGRRIVSVAWQGAAGGVDEGGNGGSGDGSPGITAKTQGGGAVLDGTAWLVQAPSADAFIVAAREAGGPSLWLVDRSQDGLTIHEEPLADGTQSARLVFAGVKLGADDRLAGQDAASVQLSLAVDLATIASSAELLGVMERALELTLEYLRTRRQFGRAIGSFQALQHRAVDLWIAKELSRAALDQALSAATDPSVLPAARSAAASGARARVAQSAFQLLNQAIQMHGAIGYTDEYDLGLLVNRGLALVTWPGDARTHRHRYARMKDRIAPAGAAA